MKVAGNRQADRQAIDGGHVRSVTDGWAPLEQPPILDEASTHYPKRGKKKKVTKEHCRGNPNGHTHEWMKDEEELPVYREAYELTDFWNPLTRENEPYYSYNRVQVGTKPRLFKLCVHCGVTLVKGRGYRPRSKWIPIHEARNYYTQYRSYNGRKVIR